MLKKMVKRMSDEEEKANESYMYLKTSYRVMDC